MVRKLLTIIVFFIPGIPCYAQTVPTDSVSFENKVVSAIDNYVNQVGVQAEIYNGREYNFLPRATKGTPYLDNKFEFTPSLIKYNGTWYRNIPILYDTYKDLVVAKHPENQASYILSSAYLSDFVLFDHHYIHVISVANLPDGYYDQLYTGKTTVLTKAAKARTENVSAQGVEVTFEDKMSYYIQKAGVYYSANSKGSVLNVFRDRKKELNAYLKGNGINFKENKAAAIAKMAAYYDQINK